MVVKDDELGDIDDESLARVKLIVDKKKHLEDTAEQVRQEIKDCFERLTEALKNREKQLLRQVEAIHRQQLSLVQSNSELLPAISSLSASFANERELIDKVLNFGKLELSNSIAVNDSEPYKVEEYQEACEDFVHFDKSLKSESEELDVNSVIRRKRNSSGNASKTISISLNCTSCDSCKFENNSTSVPSTTNRVTSALPTLEISNSFEKSPIKIIENETSTSAETEYPTASDKATASENLYFENESSNDKSCSKDANEKSDQIDASKTDCTTVKTQDMLKDAGMEHPVQIQQWLQQILAETETEPIIHEIGQFSKIPNTRLYREFPVET